VLLHVDTDFGGDPDDACALVMLLGWPDVEVTGVTTCLEVDGQRAGCAAHYLELLDRRDIPVAAGVEGSLTNDERHSPTWGDPRFWPEPVPARPGPPERALALLAASVERGAAIVAIGSFANLAALELARPGALSGARVVATAGWIDNPPAGYPRWGPAMDFNVQCDTRAAAIVAAAADLTLVTLPASIRAVLRERDLAALGALGPVGALLARQSEAYAALANRRALVTEHTALPPDLVNFHWDPVTAAVAAGWPGAASSVRRLRTEYDGAVLRFVDDPEGRVTTVVTEVDGARFRGDWLTAVARATR